MTTEPYRSILKSELDFSCRRGGRVPYDDEPEDDINFAELADEGKAAEMELFAARHAAGLHIRTGEPVNRREDAAARDLDKQLRRAAKARLQ